VKAASAGLIAALQANKNLLRCQLYTITLLSGTVLRYTDWSTPITLGGNIYASPFLDSAPGFTVGKTTTSIGLQSDSTDMTISYDADTRIEGVTPGAFVNGGGLDGAIVQIDTLFMETAGDSSLGVVNRYTGIVDQAKVTLSDIQVTVASRVSMLNGAFPRNFATPQCNHALFDSGCTLTKSSFAVSGTVTSSTGQLVVKDSALTQPNSYFALGSIVWLTGNNAGITSQVMSYTKTGGIFQLVYPLPGVIQVGDTFTAYPGCPKTRTACGNTNAAVGPVFNNLAHFRGYPYVPTPETILMGGTAQQVSDNSGPDAGKGGTGISTGTGGASGNFHQQ
jgi:uncharacterized phage protein (TIGR02218 family)